MAYSQVQKDPFFSILKELECLSMQREKLAQRIKQAPKTPGVYRFLDIDKKEIYIGKAVNIKSRLNSYLKTKDSRIQTMIQEADTIAWKVAGSDIEALILESRLIKKHLPKFNVVMRDDKQYAYVAFSREAYPRIWITHQKREPADYIGPFTEAGALRDTLKYLRRIFPYCTCAQPHHVRCLNAHIGKCLGDCCLKQSPVKSQKLKVKSAYQKNIRAIRDILTGKRTLLVKRLEKEMGVLAQKEDFESAIALRGKIDRIKRIFENAGIIKNFPPSTDGSQELATALKLSCIPTRIEGYNISNIQGVYATGSMVLFRHGQPDNNSYRKFKIKTVFGADDTAMLKEVLARRFRHREWQYPDLVIIDGGKGQLNAAAAALRAISYKPQAISKIPVIALTKDNRHRGHHIYTTLRSRPYTLSQLPQAARNLILA
ncbi:MAG: GIY-YIG nuclease family protein, partial [Patescibacteria group bacterium]